MESNKYFIPDIEDIRVGYEYERAIIRLLPPQPSTNIYIEGWYNAIVLDIDLSLEWREWIKMGFIRIPYLTKEQVEAEGWKCITKRGDPCFTKDNFELVLCTEDHTINLGEDRNYPFYYGECKDINTFRWICKLLKI
jgi:hypothetical protein